MLYEVRQLADGWTGTHETVATIKRLVDQSLTDPVVRSLAESIIRRVPERDKNAEIRAISNYVRRHIRYTNEPVETIKTPRVLVDEIRKYGVAVGDCDDHITLWLALHRLVGTRARIQVVSQRQDGEANHIYGEVWNGHRWITDDTIKKDSPLGWEPPREQVTRRHTYEGGEPSRVPAVSEVGCCGGSCSRTMTPLMPEAETGLGIVPLIIAGITAATTAASIAAQMQMQKKANKLQEKAMKQAQSQFEEQQKGAQEQASSAERIAAMEAGKSDLPPWAVPVGLLGGAALLAWYLLKD